ncbi:MAG: molybdopterin molybdotransferase MoeA [Verrucomicrobia bacterium]|nr:molybdopterin molybdotransferase MoeA [Verrucomicrobiota bacterium]
MKTMISVDEAENLIREYTPPWGAEERALKDIAGCVLREDIFADRDLPPFSRATMDGIAIAFSAWANGRRDFSIEDVAQAGQPGKQINDTSEGCIQIMTGAVLPAGCDCVVPVEELEITSGQAMITTDVSPKPMQFIHLHGSDRKKGDLLLKCGTRLQSKDVGVIASVGKATASVAVSPRTAVISNGNELVDVGRPIEQHQVRLSNSYAIRAALNASGLSKVDMFHYHDSEREILKGIQTQLADYDVLVLSGGVSMGAYDFVPSALKQAGVDSVFHKIRQRPGKPFWFGVSSDRKPVYALPGNPVSTLMCLHRYVLPALLAAMGATAEKQVFVKLAKDISFDPALTFFPPACLESSPDGVALAHILEYHGSGDFAALAGSDGLVELPADTDMFPAGTVVRFHSWRC